jgi:hypothetical protein
VNSVLMAMGYVIFAAMTSLVVGVYCYAMSHILPPLRDEPSRFLVIPMTVISGLVSLSIYGLLSRQHQRSTQTFTLYVAFLLSAIVYGVYLWAVIPDGTAGLIILALVAAHLYGLPAFLVVLMTHRLLIRAGLLVSARDPH